MKRLLFVVVASVALSAVGQTGSDSRATAGGLLQVEPSHRMPAPSLEELHLLVDASNEMTANAQAGCPLQIVEASFERPGQVMLTAEGNHRSGPTLSLNYRNASGKDIESVTLTGWIKIKDSPYQLDYVTHPFSLELSRDALLQKDAEGRQALRLASNAFGFDRIELSQVVFVDGTYWKSTRKNCAYQHEGGPLRAKAW